MHKELKAWLRKHDYSQRHMARLLGIDHTLVNKWVKGHRKPSRELIPAVAELTGIPMERML